MKKQELLDYIDQVLNNANAISILFYRKELRKVKKMVEQLEDKPKVINLNDTVKVKLTEAGVKQYKKKIKEWFGEVTPMEVENYIREADSKGYTKFQLWEFMNIFGELFLYPTFEKERLPIENNTLYLICGAEMEVEDE